MREATRWCVPWQLHTPLVACMFAHWKYLYRAREKKNYIKWSSSALYIKICAGRAAAADPVSAHADLTHSIRHIRMLQSINFYIFSLSNGWHHRERNCILCAGFSVLPGIVTLLAGRETGSHLILLTDSARCIASSLQNSYLNLAARNYKLKRVYATRWCNSRCRSWNSGRPNSKPA